MRTAVVVSALLLLAACGSTRPSNIPQPDIAVGQAGPFYFGQQPTADVTIDVRVTNRASVPLILREVQVNSTNAEQYYFPNARRTYKETIAPGETKTVQMLATAVAANTHPRQAQPVFVRTSLLFEASGKSFREVVTREFSPIP